ncbi:ABC transporter permease [Cellulomonas biazotea]|uniref:Transport permease protein n=1 Tax=Cellulomonas biazotea TaxID=1709 RepID=A0A402DM92_9CELL|nr:ABC transporter permease [Cellulomonas biazotea]GCE75236.1 transport permease protein [Cellulomonas biazotea]
MSATTLTPTPRRLTADPAGLDLPSAVSPALAVTQSLTMAWRGLVKIRRTPEQLMDVTLQPILFTLMFTYIFGGAISGSVQDYLPVIIPGILVQTVITTSVVTGVQLREDMDKGVFDRFKSLPIARVAPLAGALLADMVRYLIATTLTFTMGYVMGYRPGGGIGGVVMAGLLVVVCSWSLSWIFAFFGVIGRTATAVQGTSFLVLFPLTFLSNAFVDPSTMPRPLQVFADANPVSHLVTAVRELANTAAVTHQVGLALLGSAVVVAVFAPLAVRAYMRRA